MNSVEVFKPFGRQAEGFLQAIRLYFLLEWRWITWTCCRYCQKIARRCLR